MGDSYKLLDRNHYLSTHVGLVKEWRAQDVVGFSQLIDFTEIELERSRRARAGLTRPTYTAFVVDSIAQALRNHPKMNRIVYHGLGGYRHRASPCFHPTRQTAHRVKVRSVG